MKEDSDMGRDDGGNKRRSKKNETDRVEENG